MEKFRSKLSAFFRGEKFTSGTITAILLATVIVINVIVYALTVKFGLYIYTADAVDLTISGSTDSLFEKVVDKNEKVTVMFCRAQDKMVLDEVGYFHETAKQFADRYDFIDIEYVNIITKRDSKNNLVNVSEYCLTDDNGEPMPLYESSVIFIGEKYHKTIIDIISSTFTYDSASSSYQSYNGEEVFASMVAWVMHDEHQTAYFTTYHGEAVDLGFANMLTCAGFNVDTLDLRKNEVPEDAGLVIISNPIKDFERSTAGSHIRSEIERLTSYMERGGNIYVAIDPYVEKLSVLEEFLSAYGIEISETKKDGKALRNIVKDSANAITADSFTIVSEIEDNDLGSKISAKIKEYNEASVIIREAAALNVSGTAEKLLVTSPASSLYAGSEVADTAGNYCIGAVARVDGKFGAQSNIFVMPSIYLTATDAVVTTGYANRDFVYAMFEYVYGISDIPYGCNMVYTDTGMLENLTMGTARIITALLLSIPAVIAVVGAVVVTRRKNR